MQFAAPLAAAASVVLFVRSWRASLERKKRVQSVLVEVRRQGGPPSPPPPPPPGAALTSTPANPAALAQYRELFDTPVERLHALRDALVEQMEAGLAGQVRRACRCCAVTGRAHAA